MDSEKITLYKASDDKTRLIEQYPKTVSSNVYDFKNNKFMSEVLDDVSTQLAQTNEEIYKVPSVLSDGDKASKAVVTFISDDGATADYNTVMPIFESFGIRYGLGIITSYVGANGYMGWQQLRDASDRGFEIMSHSHLHQDSTTLTKDAFEQDLLTSLRLLHQNGHYPKSFVYPYNAYSNDTTAVTQKYMRYSFARTRSNALNQGRNYPIIDNQRVARVGFGSYFDVANAAHPNDTTSLAYYKSRVDEAVANNSLIVFVMHPWHTDHTATQNQHLRDLITYIKSLNVPILNPSDAMDVCGNIVQIGRGTHTKFWVDNKGKIDASDARVKFSDANEYNIASTPNDFPLFKITHTVISGSNASGFPENKAGVLTTYNLDSAITFRYQEYVITSDGTNRIYRRNATSVSAWSQFVSVQDVVYDSHNTRNGLDLHTTYKINAITYTPITTAYAVDTANGLPRTVGGVLRTERIGEHYYHAKQTYTTSNILETSKREFEYERFVNADGSWTAWQRIGGTSANYPSGNITVPAQSTVDKTFTVTGITGADTVSVYTVDDIPAGIIFSLYRLSNGEAIVRFANVTATPLTVNNVRIYFNSKNR